MKSIIRNQAFLGLIFICFMSTVEASIPVRVMDVDTVVSKEKDLGEVVVTGSRTTRLLKNVPVPTKVVKAAEIKAVAPTSFIDLIQYILPGFEFTQHGSRDQLNSQGFDESSILFLIDGDLITTGARGGIDFERINPDNIERIEVLRGAASALYGSNAIGGVINIITKKNKEDFSIDYSSRMDSRLGHMHSAIVGVKTGVFSSQMVAQYRSFRGFSLSDAYENRRNVAGSDVLNLNEKMTVRPLDQLTIKLEALVNRRKQHWDDKIDLNYNSYDQKLAARWKFNEQSDLDVSYHYNSYQNDTCLIQTPERKIRPIFDERMHHFRTQYNLNVADEHFLNLGFEYLYDNVASARLSSPDSPGRKWIDNKVIYGQYTFNVLPELILSYGGRLDAHSGFGLNYTSRFSALYNFEHISNRLSYAEGFRAPTLQELYFFFNHGGMFFIYGDENLKPERSRMLTYSVDGRWLNFSFMGSAFVNFMQDRIALNYVNSSYVYTNVRGLTNSYGVEAQAKLSLPFGLGLKLSYAYTYDKWDIQNEKGDKMKTSTTRPHAATAMLSYRKMFTDNYRLSANFSARFLSQLRTVGLDDQKEFKVYDYPHYIMCRINVEQTFAKHYSLNLGVDNLFAYVPKALAFNSPLSPGRIYYGSIRVKF